MNRCVDIIDKKIDRRVMGREVWTDSYRGHVVDVKIDRQIE